MSLCLELYPDYKGNWESENLGKARIWEKRTGVLCWLLPQPKSPSGARTTRVYNEEEGEMALG